MHPRLFPATPLDPFNPPRLRATAQIEGSTLLLTAPGSGAHTATFGTESLKAIRNVAIKRLTASAQVLEILRMSALRYLVVAIALTIYVFVFHEHDPVYSVLIGLAGALVSAPLFFMFRGGLSVEGEVVRFQFYPNDARRGFYIEVDPPHEPLLRDALSNCGVECLDDPTG
jgi:hypothetical protein